MANTIYSPATELTSALDSKEIAKRYDEESSVISNCIDKLHEVEQSFEFLTEKTQDNGDPLFQIKDAIRELGLTLAFTINYRDEYLKEANGNEEEVEE